MAPRKTPRLDPPPSYDVSSPSESLQDSLDRETSDIDDLAKTLQSSKLTDLSLDTLFRILRHLDPRDIISVRKTCKTLSKATMGRTVWAEALRRICDLHSIFQPTFSVKDMSLKALEHAALSPARFSSIARNKVVKDNKTLRAYSSLGLKSQWAARFPDKSIHRKFEDFRLVPGGRFLITKSTLNVVHLWDLGLTSKETWGPNSVTSFSRSRNTNLAILDVRPTENGLGLGVFLIENESEETDSSILVFEIDLLSPNPTFISVASLNIKGKPRCFSCHKGRVGFYVSRPSITITVWDFKQDTVARLSWINELEPDNLLLYDDIILAINTDQFSVWKAPPFESEPGELANLLGTFRHPLGSGLLLPSLSWMPDFHHCPHFASICTVTNSARSSITAHAQFYTMKQVIRDADTPNWHPFPTRDVKLNIARLRDPQDHDRHHSRHVSTRICDRYITHSWLAMHEPLITFTTSMLSTLAMDGEQEVLRLNPDKTVNLWMPAHLNSKIRVFDLCPASGRLCVMTNPSEIQVIDYLAPF